MWMPTRSVSPVRCTENASSISVVPTSSRLKARTSASGSPRERRAPRAPGSDPAREELVHEALQVVLVRIGQQAAALEKARGREPGLLAGLLERLRLGLVAVGRIEKLVLRAATSGGQSKRESAPPRRRSSPARAFSSPPRQARA
jgi:hypothetical protein